MDQADRINSLSQIDRFKDLPLYKLKHLASCCEVIAYHAHEFIFRQNDSSSHLFINLEGVIHLFRYYDSQVPYIKESIIKLKGLCDIRHD